MSQKPHPQPPQQQPRNVLHEPVGIIGAGVSGLINAFVLTQDGFTRVEMITRDKSVGGVWARERVYPGLTINNIHGEYRFSALPMPPRPPNSPHSSTSPITGLEMCDYMETFSRTYLEGKVRFHYEKEVVNIRRDERGVWNVKVECVRTGRVEVLRYARIVLCTGGCSTPHYPPTLTPTAAERARFRGIVCHSSTFGSKWKEIVEKTRARPGEGYEGGHVVVVGGGKSAQDICAKLALEGCKVSNIFHTTDVFIAASRALPDWIRKSRLLGVMAGHIDLRTTWEKFLHKTTPGANLVSYFWDRLKQDSLDLYGVPEDSPLRLQHSLFWSVRVNDGGGLWEDEGIEGAESASNPPLGEDKKEGGEGKEGGDGQRRKLTTGYHSLVTKGLINPIAPARAVGYGMNGRSVLVNNGEIVPADVVVLATGWKSSWTGLFDEDTIQELGIGRHKATVTITEKWDYKTLQNAPPRHPESDRCVTSIYRGLVPARNLHRRDFAIGGALFTSNAGYSSEVAAHWIASYFRGDKMKLPESNAEAVRAAERKSAWIRTRFPDQLAWVNESYSATLDFWAWPQAADEMLEDMYLKSMRSGGNFFTWPFKVIDLKEISTLTQERKALREKYNKRAYQQV